MATRRKVARKKVALKSARVATGPEAQIALLKEMFAAFLLLQGVAKHNVAEIVAMNKTRVSELSVQVSRKARAAK